MTIEEYVREWQFKSVFQNYASLMLLKLLYNVVPKCASVDPPAGYIEQERVQLTKVQRMRRGGVS
jgi:hypothetical protein